MCRCTPPTASPTLLISRSTWRHSCSAKPWEYRTSTPKPRAPACTDNFSTPIQTISCCSTTCWESAVRKWSCPRSRPTRDVGGLTALINSASLARPGARGVRHRGRALDRRGQRVLARRLPGRRPTDSRAHTAHPSARIPRSIESDAGSTDDRTAATERRAGHHIGGAISRHGSAARRSGGARGRTRWGKPVFRRGDGARSGRARRAARRTGRLLGAR